jgi:hypothetical protein
VREARKHGAEVAFVMLPIRADLAGRGVRRFLPDAYGRTLQIVQSRNYVVVDGRRALLSSDGPVSRLFHERR